LEFGVHGQRWEAIGTIAIRRRWRSVSVGFQRLGWLGVHIVPRAVGDVGDCFGGGAEKLR